MGGRVTLLKYVCILTVLSVYIPCVVGVECVGVDPCTCVFDDGRGTVDLTSVGNKNGLPRFEDQPSTQDVYQYSYNPCYPFSQYSCQDASMCQSDFSGASWVTGYQSSATWSFDGINLQLYYYADTDTFRETFITVVCDPTYEEPVFEVEGESPPGEPQYRGRITTKCACPNGCTGGMHVDVSVNLSAGSILLIILIAFLIVYIVLGMSFMRLRHQATGRQLLPNVDFWGALPGLVKARIMCPYQTRGPNLESSPTEAGPY